MRCSTLRSIIMLTLGLLCEPLASEVPGLFDIEAGGQKVRVLSRVCNASGRLDLTLNRLHKRF
jgi:hypothetical protein